MNTQQRVSARENIYRVIRKDDLSSLRVLDIVNPFEGCHENVVSPLNSAIMHDAFKCAEWLVSIGADVNQRCYSYTPLIRTVYDSYERVTKLLLDAGARIEAADADGATALDHACMRSHRRSADVAYMLIDHGARLNVPRVDASPSCYKDAITAYYHARLGRRARQRAFMACVLSSGSNNNKDLVRLFSNTIKK